MRYKDSWSENGELIKKKLRMGEKQIRIKAKRT